MIDPRIESLYNVRRTVTPAVFDANMAAYRSRSDDAVRRLAGHRDIVYDAASGQRLDIWAPGTAASPRPVFVVIHGGYWRALSRHDTAFMARPLADEGIATVTVDYGLAPGTRLEEIVRQVRTAVAWVHRNGGGYGLDTGRIVVGGSSAGGHLTGAVMTPGWQTAMGVPRDAVRAAMPISGLFDLRPLVHASPNEWLSLTPDTAAALSPALSPALTAAQDPESGAADSYLPPAVIAVAEHDGEGFLTQSRRFHDAWSHRASARLLTIPGRNHYDVFLDLADPSTALFRALTGLFETTAGAAAARQAGGAS
ncbi:alpha/beta hydrolase [Tomitella fengzijianii]|uniref:Alpha/beta hydrolase n=1 Tax=Tomitella fengzijianii TaxID=2597660 RepID=A0A516WZ04_9ACTN|nr:alpha/beta hydrolase [Tomitella fengzijianii]QDQ96063.1 alpha/beta hydrolase [Tomitella fengzijianii]